MLLAIDIGNTNVVWGIYEGRTLKGHWRLATEASKTADEYGILFVNILQQAGIDTNKITDAILSSVVPSLTAVFDEMVETYFKCTPLIVSSDLDMGIQIAYPYPLEIGSDRLVNAAAAYARYKTCLIIVDFGTATTFCAISSRGEYLGGAIAPGLGIASEALFTRTAKLPKVDLTRPKTVIGKDTAGSMQSGLIFGYAGLVDELVTRIQVELGQKATVLATGGLASLIAPESRTIQEVRPYLTLEGLELIYRKTRGEE
ncbi:MAG: type III pantothenate kinase [Nitrospiraceae bacterium]|nr:type III pantothenate kinase [Nitrospiraceae bacterium]MSR23517.1 type III pantothenate kinase [Nitrospiraceae bacterium]